MIENKFINDSMQKAFIRNKNGCIEHNQLLQEVISNARSNGKTCHITFFDLKDAFGSISHEMIDYVLKRYSIPDNVCAYIHSLYSNINGRVYAKGWTSEKFAFKKECSKGIHYLLQSSS